ncbi:hypothetical protein K0040_18920 [Terrisporobacter petrolearius]|uniref:hypothetical protein n=1 Tax=Terrisporobacter petrolearius TaxID=1460447 RepID=UPI001D16E175|nr:hypothetical protein [Terrisporobacter petrolearius]MCC3866322.1 hypothetical protein [Terrisporobacter petrolearius]
MNNMYSILEKINDLQIKLDGVSATAFTIAEAMKNDNNYMPSINLIGIVVDDITKEIRELVDEGHKINKVNKEKI